MLDLLLHTLTFREHVCYCQVCACKEFVKALAKKCKLKCPVCQREADRIVVKDAVDDERVPALRRCRSAETVREKPKEEILNMHRAVMSAQQESTSQAVAEGKQAKKQRGDSRKGTYEKTEAAFGKLFEAISASTEVGTPVQQASSDHTVIEDTWTLRHASPLQRCESATFSCDNQCPFCETPSDIDHESKCISSCLTSCRTSVFTAAGISAAASRATRRL